MDSSTRPFRPLVPAALLLLGAAVNCWCACFSAPYRPSANVIRAQHLRQALAAALPPPLDELPPGAITIGVIQAAQESRDRFLINIRGPFTADSAQAMADHVREVRRQTPGEPRFTVRILDNAAAPPILLEQFELGEGN